MASMDGIQYGVGFPLDMPVAIAFFNGSELTFVTEQSFPKYDALLEYIDEQLDDNDISLLRTPVVLTVAGEFDDDDVSVPYLPRETATSGSGLSAAAVSDEDVKSLLRAHTRADRILEYAADVKLMGSFQFERQNFHLLQLLEPLIVFGRQLTDGGTHDFALLEEADSEQMRPRLERLLHEQFVSAPVSDDDEEAPRSSSSAPSGRRQRIRPNRPRFDQ
eukprot:gene12966-9275_t